LVPPLSAVNEPAFPCTRCIPGSPTFSTPFPLSVPVPLAPAFKPKYIPPFNRVRPAREIEAPRPPYSRCIHCQRSADSPAPAQNVIVAHVRHVDRSGSPGSSPSPQRSYVTITFPLAGRREHIIPIHRLPRRRPTPACSSFPLIDPLYVLVNAYALPRRPQRHRRSGQKTARSSSPCTQRCAQPFYAFSLLPRLTLRNDAILRRAPLPRPQTHTPILIPPLRIARKNTGNPQNA